MSMMEMHPYVNFNGECEAAFKLYEECLDARPGPIFRYAGTSFEDDVPADWHDKVMHGSVTIGGQVLQGADRAPGQYEQPRGFSLSLQMTSTTEADRVFHRLAKDGTVMMPLQKTFWAARFGVVVDRFGIRWLINCDGSAQTVEA
jgi:PhnB protein